MTTVRLPKPISVNAIWRNAGRTLKSAKYRKWEKLADGMLIGCKRPCIDQPVHIEITVGAKGVRTNSDLDNFSKAYMDTLVRNGIIKDDNIKIVRSIHLRLCDGFEGAIAKIVLKDA